MKERSGNHTLNLLLHEKPIFLSLLVFTIVWFLTLFVSRTLWKESLPFVDLQAGLITFLIPFLLVGMVAAWSKKHEKLFGIFALFFAAELIFVVLNTFIFHFHINNYGDYGQLSTEIGNGEVFPRWLIGSSLLMHLYQSIFVKLPVVLSTFVYLRLAGSFLMCLFSIFLIKRYPNRLSIILPLITPIWLILAIGYDEYYPIIAPVVLMVLVLLSEDLLKKIHPVLMGAIVSVIALLYAGFVPYAIFLLIIYAIRRGWIAGLISLASAVGCSFLIILVLWPDTIANFFYNYYSALNLTEANLYPGQSLSHTPFFKPQFALSAANLHRLLFMYFWAGGISPILVIAAIITFLVKTTKKNLLRISFISVTLFFLWQVFYFFFMIPRLGPTNDIDLFFSVYITVPFFAGWLLDETVSRTQPKTQALVKNVCFAIVTANTSVAFLYFAFLGLPALG